MTDNAAIQQVLSELEGSGYMFAKISRVQVKAEHTIGEDGSDKQVTHFFGFANEVGANNKRKPKSIWFKKANLRHHIFMGPVKYTGYMANTVSSLPKRGQMLFGKTAESEKGLTYLWCIHGALGLFNFMRMLQYGTRLSKSSARLYKEVNLSTSEADDSLYAMTRLLVSGDVQSFVDMLKPEAKRERHPIRKKEYTYDRLYNLPNSDQNPVEFIFLACVLARSLELYDRFVNLLQAQRAALTEPFEAHLIKWSRERLLKLIN